VLELGIGGGFDFAEASWHPTLGEGDADLGGWWIVLPNYCGDINAR